MQCYKPQSAEISTLLNFGRQTFSFTLGFYMVIVTCLSTVNRRLIFASILAAICGSNDVWDSLGRDGVGYYESVSSHYCPDVERERMERKARGPKFRQRSLTQAEGLNKYLDNGLAGMFAIMYGLRNRNVFLSTIAPTNLCLA